MFLIDNNCYYDTGNYLENLRNVAMEKIQRYNNEVSNK